MGTDPVTTLAEAARAAGGTDQDSFKRMIYASSDKLSVLASGADSLLDDAITPDAFEHILTKLMVTYPVVIVDLSGATAPVKRMVMHKAHEVVIVSNPTLPSLRSARSLLHEIKDVRGGSEKEIELVVNMKDQVAESRSVAFSDIAAALGRKPVLTVPFLPKVFATAETHNRKLGEVSGAEDIVSRISLPWRGKLFMSMIRLQLRSAAKVALSGLLGKFKAK